MSVKLRLRDFFASAEEQPKDFSVAGAYERLRTGLFDVQLSRDWERDIGTLLRDMDRRIAVIEGAVNGVKSD